MNKNSILKLSLLISISLLPSCVTPATNPQVSPSTSVSASPSSDVTSGVGNPSATASPDSQTSASPVPSVSASANSGTNPTTSVSPSAQVTTATALTIPASFLTLSYYDYYSAELKWSQITGAKSYRIYQDGKVIADNLTSLIYNVKNLTPNTNYKFDIVAVNEAGESNKSTINMRTFIPSTSSSNNNYTAPVYYPVATPTPTPMPTAPTNVIYVNQSLTTGANNGTSWANAYTDLNMALNAATSGKQVWVAKGTYLPAPILVAKVAPMSIKCIFSDRNATFNIPSGVKVYGGFRGINTEININNRNFVTNETILSGEIDEAPSLVNSSFSIKDTNNSNNSYHVVSIVSDNASSPNTGSIDGFTITAGNADGGGAPTDHGGGLLIDKASTTISNIIFTGNNANYGGAIFNDESNTTINNSKFISNTSDSPSFGGGGAIYSSNWSGTTMRMNINNSTFTSNSAYGVSNGNGGAIHNNNFTVNINGSTFNNNNSDNDGGAIYNDTSILNLANSTFNNNLGNNGSGISSDSGSQFNYLNKGNILNNTTVNPCQESSCAG